MSIWFYIGIAALVWSLYELVTGRAWLHREFRRSTEPLFYWPLVAFWLLLGVSCLIPAMWLL